MPYNYVIHPHVYKVIDSFYENVAKKYCHTYSYDLMVKNVTDAYDAICQIENGLLRRKPTISRWIGFYMASYAVEGQTRWNYAYRIDGNTVYVEDACHAQNMREFMPSIPIPKQTKYIKLTKKPLFGYSFVMNDQKEYNLIDNNGKLVTKWFKDIRPFQQPYGKYQIIAYINVGGYFCALGYDGKVYNMNKTWQEMYTENKNILNSALFMNIITENIDNTMKTNKKVIRLTESDLHTLITEAVKETLNEAFGQEWNYGNDDEWDDENESLNTDENLEHEFSAWVKIVSRSPHKYGLNYNPIKYLRDCYYGDEDNDNQYFECEEMIADMAEDFAKYKRVYCDSTILNAVKNVAMSGTIC